MMALKVKCFPRLHILWVKYWDHMPYTPPSSISFSLSIVNISLYISMKFSSILYIKFVSHFYNFFLFSNIFITIIIVMSIASFFRFHSLRFHSRFGVKRIRSHSKNERLKCTWCDILLVTFSFYSFLLSLHHPHRKRKHIEMTSQSKKKFISFYFRCKYVFKKTNIQETESEKTSKYVKKICCNINCSSKYYFFVFMRNPYVTGNGLNWLKNKVFLYT